MASTGELNGNKKLLEDFKKELPEKNFDNGDVGGNSSEVKESNSELKDIYLGLFSDGKARKSAETYYGKMEEEINKKIDEAQKKRGSEFSQEETDDFVADILSKKTGKIGEAYKIFEKRINGEENEKPAEKIESEAENNNPEGNKNKSGEVEVEKEEPAKEPEDGDIYFNHFNGRELEVVRIKEDGRGGKRVDFYVHGAFGEGKEGEPKKYAKGERKSLDWEQFLEKIVKNEKYKLLSREDYDGMEKYSATEYPIKAGAYFKNKKGQAIEIKDYKQGDYKEDGSPRQGTFSVIFNNKESGSIFPREKLRKILQEGEFEKAKKEEVGEIREGIKKRREERKKASEEKKELNEDENQYIEKVYVDFAKKYLEEIKNYYSEENGFNKENILAMIKGEEDKFWEQELFAEISEDGKIREEYIKQAVEIIKQKM